MDQEFDRMIRERMDQALAAAMKSHVLAGLRVPRESRRQRLQRKLGELLIVVGMRLRDGAPSTSHTAKWSPERV